MSDLGGRSSAAHAVCPSDLVAARVDVVWGLLTNPAGWGDVFDAHIVSVEPPGLARVGQHVLATSGFGPLRFRLQFEFTEVDDTEHTLCLDIRLPFAIRNEEHLTCAAVSMAACRVTYGCNFTFPQGWRGACLRALLWHRFESGPADSLARLKRAAQMQELRKPG